MSEEVIAPGKKLYKPLVHPTNGNVMLPAGTVLTATYIDRLTRQGLTAALAECLEAPAPGTPGAGPAKDLDAFDIEIPELPDILLEFMKPATPPPPPAVALPATPPGAAPAAPGYVPTAAAPAWAGGAPAASGGGPGPAAPPPQPPAYAAAPPSTPPAPGYVPAAAAPGWAGAAAAPVQPAGAPGFAPPPPGPVPVPPPMAPQLRYHHNPQHILPERSLMGAMLAVDTVDQQIREGKLPAFDAISRIVQEVIDRLGSNQSLLANGVELRIVNQVHARSHPVNVFTMSVAMGIALGYDAQKLLTLGVSALCHDIGKTAIPPEVLNKVGPLTQQDIDLLRAHTLMGKRIMEKLPWASAEMARVVYEHHERMDGSGYPLRLVGNQIHEMSRIVAVAEVFDALVSDTGYRPRYAPELCYNTIRSGEKMGLDPMVIRAFSRFIFPYPVNSFVMMESQEIGQVVQNNRQDPVRPVLKLNGRVLNLMEHPERKIMNSHFQAF